MGCKGLLPVPLVLIAACLALSTPRSAAVQPAGDEPAAHVVLNGRVPLSRLVDLAAAQLGLSVSYDVQALRAEVTIRVDEGISGDELWRLVNEQLQAHNLTTIRSDDRDTLAVAPLSEAKDRARIELGDAPQVEAGFQRVLLTPQSTGAEEIEGPLRKLISRAGSIERLDQRTLLVSDLTPRLRQIRVLLGRLDSASETSASRTLKLEHLAPERAIALVTQVAAKRKLVGGPDTPGEFVALPDGKSVLVIAPERGLDGWETLIRALDQLEPVETRHYSPSHFALAETAGLIEETVRGSSSSDGRWRLVQDQLTGSLVITATPSDHERVQAVLDRLAAAPVESQRPVRSFVVRNRSVTEVVEVLRGLIDAGVLEAGAFERDDAVRAAGAQQSSQAASDQAGRLNQPRRSEQGLSERRGPEGIDLSLTADEGTNTLIAVGHVRLLDQLEGLLKIIDVRQPQVVLEVLLVSLTDGQTQDLGVELAALINEAGTRFALASLFGLSSVLPSDAAAMPGSGSGGTAVVLDPGNFSAVIRALETVNGGRSLSIPRILVNNNESGEFNSVVQEPFASTNASNTVATTSFGGTQDAGTTISIRPQIAAGDFLVLEYSVSLSSFTGESADPSLPPPRQQNNLSSVATIPDGYTIAVGGIELTTEAEAVSKVPLLGDLPGIGALFRSTSISSSQSRFYVFIRASVMRHHDFLDLKYVSDQEILQAGVDDGWPEVAPRIIK